MNLLPVRYIVRFPEPATHYVSVEAIIPTEGQACVELFMPVWTPGSYLIREYARHVEGIAARSERGQPLPFVKSRKNRWSVQTEAARRIHISYRVYCREMSVRTNWVEDGFALLNGAPTFITSANDQPRPHEVQVELPAEWKTSISGLPNAPDGIPHHYAAPDYDTLVDSPILAGNPAIYRFEVDGVPHCLANQGEDGCWDGARSVADVQKIVKCQRLFWGSLPYARYVFLNMITEASGGLEHANSVCLMTNRWATGNRRDYVSWLSLVSHEFFHVWNIKRLRPAELGSIDYESENHTRSLWVAEGVTDYYAPLLMHRARITSRCEYLGEDSNYAAGSLSGVINKLQSTPGRLVQSAEQASFDAWIKLYRPDENTANTTISYYTKGAVVAWLLDARIRRASNGAKSLDDLMRLAFARYSGKFGFTPEQFEQAAGELAGVSLREFFRRSVESTEELDYTEALDWFGLRFKRQPSSKNAWLGAQTRVDGGRFLVSRVLRGTPAFEAGLNVEDEMIALGDFRIHADQWEFRLENYRPGDKVSLLVSRRGKLTRLDVVLGQEPAKNWQLEVRPDSSSIQKQNLEAWLTQQ